jgi:hypothetical protein
MAKRKKRSEVQKRKAAKSPPKAKKLSSAARGKKTAKRAVAKAEPRRACEVKLSPQQMRAMIELLPFHAPKLSAVGVSHLTGQDFASALDRAIQRSHGGPPIKLIEALPVDVEHDQ